MPAFDPIPGIYYRDIEISISSGTTGASIYYTLDGSSPSQSTNPYSTPITLDLFPLYPFVVKAIAVKWSQ